ncbi:MAG: ABC transporter substrate-binding protein [Bacillota bacterium]
MKHVSNKAMLAVLLALCMTVTLLSGCNNAPAGQTETSPSSAPAQQQENTPASSSQTRVVVDSYGREVELPAEINSVVLTSSYPVYMSFMCAIGEQEKVINGIPASFDPETYKFDAVFAPQIVGAPTVMDSASGDVSVEEVLALNPDVCLTSTEEMVKTLEDKGITVIGIKLSDYDSFRDIFRIVGEVFNKQDVAQQYLAYLDETLQLVQDRIGAIPETERTRVLYFDKQRMLRPNTVSEWWIPAAGGISVTADQADLKQVEMDMEAIWKANPDVIIEMLAGNVGEIYADPLWGDIKAVQDQRVFNTPVGCHLMGNWTSEQPILILWAAKNFYPEQFADIDLVQRFGDFYSTYYHVDLSEEQIKDIIDG